MGNGIALAGTSLSPWSYSLFPGVTGSNITYPSDSASIWNDKQLFNFDSDANRLLNGSTALCQQLIPAMDKWYADVAATFQKLMMSIQSGNSTVKVDNKTDNLDSTGKLKEGQILNEITKMGSGASTKDRMGVEVTFKDKDGNEQKTTLLRRVISLLNDYRLNPDKAELTKENYEKIWSIAETYAKTGDLSTDDYKTLLEIAKNPGTSVSGKKEDKDEKVVTPASDEANAKKTGETGAVFKQGVNAAVDGYKNGLIGWGTKYEQLDAGQAEVNADNVVEVYDEYYKQVGINQGETLIDSIYNDFDNWTDGVFTSGSGSRFTAISDKLAERANNLIEKYAEKSGLTEADVEAFKNDIGSVNQDNYGSKKQFLSDTFKNFVAKIKGAEAKLVKDEKDAAEKAKADKK